MYGPMLDITLVQLVKYSVHHIHSTITWAFESADANGNVHDMYLLIDLTFSQEFSTVSFMIMHQLVEVRFDTLS